MAAHFFFYASYVVPRVPKVKVVIIYALLQGLCFMKSMSQIRLKMDLCTLPTVGKRMFVDQMKSKNMGIKSLSRMKILRVRFSLGF